MADPNSSKEWYKTKISLDLLKGEYKGLGVSVGVFDDGIEKTHADLAGNYNAAKEFKYGGVTFNPQSGPGYQAHGTAVSGIIAAVEDNGIGGSGIASKAQITGVDILGNAQTYFIEAIRYMSAFDVTSNSWNWSAKYADSVGSSLGVQFQGALKFSADTGRGGLGTVMAVAAGNDWATDRRDANYSEFSAARYTITVGAYSDQGSRSYYSNTGSNLLVSAPSNGGFAGITTTDETGYAGYSSGNTTDGFGGTSAATPIVSGVATLMLGANKALGWRDVQEIMAITADVQSGGFEENRGGLTTNQTDLWAVNGARNVNGGGMAFSNDAGFGMVDAYEAVRLAEVWSLFGPAKTSANEVTQRVAETTAKAIPNGTGAAAEYKLSVTQAIDIDYVSLTLTLTHGNVEDLKVELISPDGTQSLLLTVGSSSAVNGFSGKSWMFGSNEFKGELSAGVWTVRITDTRANGYSGSVSNATLDVYGDASSINNVYHFTDDFQRMLALEPSRSVIRDSNGGTDWLNFAAIRGGVDVDLGALKASMTGVAALTIAAGTVIENVVAGDGNDTLRGNEIANHLLGMRGNDSLFGNGGQDRLAGGAGDDVIDGGADVDTVVFSGKRSDYTILKNADGSLTVTDKRANADGIDKVLNVETFAFADTTIAASALVLDGSSKGIQGTEGNDTLEGTTGDDVMAALGGNDSINGSTGKDTIDGGAGTDTVSYAASTAGVTVDLVTGKGLGGFADGDILTNVESVTGASGFASTLRGNAGNNVLTGGNGNDLLAGREGADTLNGGGGLDMADYSESNAGVTINLTLTGGQSGGHAQGDILLGIENILGSAHADALTGNGADNSLNGGGGNDALDGGAGTDSVVYSGKRADYTITKNTDGSFTVTDKRINADGIDKVLNVETFVFADKSFATSALVLDVVDKTIRGTEGNDTLNGTTGDDVMAALGGNDTINGSTGKDTIDGGAGTDTVSYAASTAGVTVDLVTGKGLGGFADGDILTNVESVTGASGFASTLRGNAGNNVLTGGNGNDLLAGREGADTLNGGGGLDMADYSESNAGVTINLTLTGGQSGGHAQGDILLGIENILGSAHADALTGNGADNTLNGGGGNDALVGGSGADTLDGGAGVDTASYLASTAAVNVDLARATQTGGDAQGDRLIAIENLLGSAHADTLAGDGAANTLDGGAGNDILRGNAGQDRIVGGAGNDTIDGGADSDSVVYGGKRADYTIVKNSDGSISVTDKRANADGVDKVTNVETFVFSDKSFAIAALTFDVLDKTIRGTEGNDTLNGTTGDDVMAAAGGNDTINGSAGKDTIDGGLGTDTVNYSASTAGVSVDLVTGKGIGGFADGDVLTNVESLTGASAFNSTLRGNSGVNVLIGGNANDILAGREGADTLNGAGGIDFADYSESNAAVIINLTLTTGQTGGHAQGDLLIGIESVTGSAHADTLTGDANANTLLGGAGNDTLVGGRGNDRLDGGAGSDTAIYSGRYADYRIALNSDGSRTITDLRSGAPDGSDTVLGVETLRFADGLLLIGAVANAAGQTTAASGSSTVFQVSGGSAHDSFVGTTGNDLVNGGAGNDTFYGSAGADVFVGGDGWDVVNYSASTGAVDINLTRATQLGGDAAGDALVSIEAVYGSNHNDIIRGGTGNTVFGGNGNDTLYDGAGTDSFYGDAGDDHFVWGGGRTNLFDGGSGIDTLNLGLLARGATVNLATRQASNGVDTATLNNFERVIGSNHADTIIGSVGADWLTGAKGNDTLTGGAGADVFVFNAGDGSDTVTDFVRGQDKLEFTGDIAASNIALVRSGNDMLVRYTGGEVRLIGVSALTASDIVYS